MLDINIKVVFANVDGEFDVITGSTISREYNETLDSAVIIVRSDSKLNINPYDEVKIIINDNVSFCMLIDNYSSQIEEFDKKSFIYNINLMSLTKYLEKIQLPNRIITHSLVSGQKTILEYIKQYMELYIPKIKTRVLNDTWTYASLIGMKEDSYYSVFNVKCRDMQFSQPTLREVLTNLMLQVGCIPIVVKDGANNVLSFLNFKKEPKDIISYNQLDLYNFSNSSDSYVNSLTNMGDKILDDENIVISETIGFRDPKSVFLKKQENLKLNTSLPIYSINKMSMCRVLQGQPAIYGAFYPNLCPMNYAYFNTIDISTGNTLGLGLQIPNKAHERVFFSDIEITGYDADYVKGRTYYYGSAELQGSTPRYDNQMILYLDFGEDNEMATYFANIANVALYAKVKITNQDETEVYYNGEVYINGRGHSETKITDGSAVIITDYVRKDITPLILENSKRNLLETDFNKMATLYNFSVEKLAKYIYGTIGYNIGDNEISGFSQMYSKAVAWWKNDYTYYENIGNSVFSIDKPYSGGVAFDAFVSNESNYKYVETTEKYYMNAPQRFRPYMYKLKNPTFLAQDYYTDTTFDIEYKPLNSLRLVFTKDTDMPLELTQLDTSDSAIANLNDLGNVEKQKINRLGNEVLTGSRRYDINNLSSSVLDTYEWFSMFHKLEGGEIVFKQEIAFDKYYITEDITASKNYILQDYFTSIQTKYRAYEYVDYGKAVVRKENTKVFVLIDNYYINGDNKIFFGNPNVDTTTGTSTPINLKWVFASGMFNKNDDYEYRFKYTCQQTSGGYHYRTDISAVSFRDNLVFSMQEFDSVSYGIWATKNLLDEDLGGVPQKWYIKSETDLEEKLILFTANIANIYMAITENNTGTIEQLPEVRMIWGEVDNFIDNATLCIVNNNQTAIVDKEIKYYQDQQEKLNQTLQFEYYNTNGCVKWTDRFIDLCYFKNDNTVEKFVVLCNSYELNDQLHEETEVLNIEDYITLDTENNKFTINWLNINTGFIKVVEKVGDLYRDIIVFKQHLDNQNEDYYISLNDTKTIRVADYEKGILSFNKYKCKVNTLNREVETI